MSAATNALRRDEALEVVAFERGPYTSYSACGIPYYVGGLVEDAQRLISRSPQEHRQRGMAVRVGGGGTPTARAARRLTVRSDAGESVEPFDELVVATGAQAKAPP